MVFFLRIILKKFFNQIILIVSYGEMMEKIRDHFIGEHEQKYKINELPQPLRGAL